MKGGRGKIIVALVLAALIIAAVVIYFATKGRKDAPAPPPPEPAAKPEAALPASPPAPPPPDGQSGLDALTAACTAKDGAAVWQLLAPELQRSLEEAAAAARKLPARKLKSDLGYTGAPAELKEGVYLGALIAQDSPQAPCKGVAGWRVTSAAAQGGALWVATVDLGDGTQRELRFVDDGGRWRLAAMTAPAAAP
jgi:hypothetical protein